MSGDIKFINMEKVRLVDKTKNRMTIYFDHSLMVLTDPDEIDDVLNALKYSLMDHRKKDWYCIGG